MKKLKWLAVIVVALIAVVVLGACDLFGSGTNNGTNNNGGTNNGTNNNDGTNNGTNNNGEENTVELDESLIVRVQQPTENAMTVKPAAELISQTWNYTLTETNQIETFTYLAKTANENPLDSGTFFLDSSFNVAWHIRDSSGNAILHDSLNSNNFTTTRTTNILTLTIGETYTIRIRKGTPSGNVVIRMYAPNGTDDISGYTKVTDVLWFNAQQKIYTYTAARSGIYLLSTSFNVAWHIRDSFGNAILHDSWNSNNFTTTRSTNNVTMNEGETYTIRLQKGTPSGEYNLTIHEPNLLISIDGKRRVHDNMRFSGQVNTYTFTAPASGLYVLSTSFNVAWHIRDSFGNAILHDSWNSNNFTTTRSTNNVTMNEGETYTIRLQKGTPSGEYTFDINNN